jgi:hypothetical protein
MHESVEAVRDGADVLTGLMHTLRELTPAAEDAGKVEQIRALEELKSVVAAAQARVTSEFVAAQREANRAAGVEAERAERGIACQVALARRCSPFRARRYVGWARILTRELPETFARLEAGETTE